MSTGDTPNITSDVLSWLTAEEKANQAVKNNEQEFRDQYTRENTSLTLDIHLTSRHSNESYVNNDGQRKKFNEENPGLGITKRYGVGDNTGACDLQTGLTAGFYKNSLGHTSIYAGGTAEVVCALSDNFNIAGGVKAGLANGYGHNITSHDVVPIAQVTLRAEWDRVSTTVGHTPSFEADGWKHPSVSTLSIGFKI